MKFSMSILVLLDLQPSLNIQVVAKLDLLLTICSVYRPFIIGHAVFIICDMCAITKEN